MRRLVIVGIVAVALSRSATAAADPVRRNFLIGASLGAGGAGACDACASLNGPLFELHLGWWLNPTWALSAEVSVLEDLEATTSFEPTATTLALATVTAHVAGRIWVKGGVGLADYDREDAFTNALLGTQERDHVEGLGLGSALGYELFQSDGSIVIELSGRLGLAVFGDRGTSLMGGVALGLTWN
jgi:hypothetical protein